MCLYNVTGLGMVPIWSAMWSVVSTFANILLVIVAVNCVIAREREKMRTFHNYIHSPTSAEINNESQDSIFLQKLHKTREIKKRGGQSTPILNESRSSSSIHLEESSNLILSATITISAASTWNMIKLFSIVTSNIKVWGIFVGLLCSWGAQSSRNEKLPDQDIGLWTKI